MTRAKIPDGSKIWVELNTPVPSETSFEARPRFYACFVITDGTHRWKYLWISRRRSGFYIAHTLPGGFHETYHSDGTRHWKVPGGFKTVLPKGQPLDAFTGWVMLQNGFSTISSEVLMEMGYSEFVDEPLEKVIYLDNRTFGPHLYANVYLVEPYRHGEVPLGTNGPAFIHIITHTVPWIMVEISDRVW